MKTSASPMTSLQLPQSMPVMALADCNLFPHTMLPLYIFEPRYREMLRHVLETDRLFCIGTVRHGSAASDAPDLHEVSTAGLVRACVKRPDGTSNLILQGIRRVRFTEWQDGNPFRVAKVEPFESVHDDPARAAELAGDVLSAARQLVEQGCADVTEQLTVHLASIRDPEVLGDIVAFNFLSKPESRQLVLSTRSVTERLEHLVGMLEAEAL